MQNKTLMERSSLETGKRMVLFVCTGNTCRSPMAEAVYNKMNASEDTFARSCGLYVCEREMSKEATEALESIGIYGFEHTPRQIDDELMARADLVVGMTATHAQRMILAFPQYATKITSMPLEIEDPYGGDAEVYKLCLAQICEAVGIGFDAVDEHEAE